MSISEKVRRYLTASGAVAAAEHNLLNALCKLEKGPGHIVEKARKIFEEKMGPAILLDILATVYEEYYSEEELDAAIAFYESPFGRSIASKSVQILSKTTPMITAKANQAIGEVMKIILDDIKGMLGDDEPNPWRLP